MRSLLPKFAIIVSLVLIPFVQRAYSLEALIWEVTGQRYVGLIETLKNDAIIIAVIFLTIYLALNFQNWAICTLFKILALMVFLIAVADILIFNQFNNRLIISDVIKYSSYIPQYIADFSPKQLAKISFAAAIVIIALFTINFVLPKKESLNTAAHVTFICIIALPVVFYLTKQQRYVHNRFFENVVDYNLVILSEYEPYSTAMKTRTQNPFVTRCIPRTGVKENIIIYMVESLSAYHSKFFSGLNDWTPKLDELARDNIAFTNFYANGFNTEDGEISLILGQLPIYPPKSFTKGGGNSFNGFWNKPSSLANILKDAGYSTRFITTADLYFSSTGAWARSNGFESVEGAKSKAFTNWERFHFNAAPDGALVDRIVDITLQRRVNKDNRHSFIFAKTVSSHHPHIDPISHERSEEKVIRYVDEQAARLVEELDEIDYFSNGIVIMVGDHRAMTPLNASEIKSMGRDRAFARVPLIVIGDSLKIGQVRVESAFQQIDIYNALRSRVTGKHCISPVMGDIFAFENSVPKYIFHRRGDARNIISVFSGPSSAQIKLNGDETKFSSTSQFSHWSEDPIEFVNYLRIQNGNGIGMVQSHLEQQNAAFFKPFSANRDQFPFKAAR